MKWNLVMNHDTQTCYTDMLTNPGKSDSDSFPDFHCGGGATAVI
jgi:hypothetical protein